MSKLRDTDQLYKSYRETRAFQDSHDLRCAGCLVRLPIWEYNENGDPVVDKFCPRCLTPALSKEQVEEIPARRRVHCNRCYDNPPLTGMAWCGACAINHQNSLRGQQIEGIDDAVLDATITELEKRWLIK